MLYPPRLETVPSGDTDSTISSKISYPGRELDATYPNVSASSV